VDSVSLLAKRGWNRVSHGGNPWGLCGLCRTRTQERKMAIPQTIGSLIVLNDVPA
jgi:hypothetical protein